MRWYKIIAGGTTFDATGDPNALNCEIDIVQAYDHLPKSGSFVRLWGIALQTLLNAKSFNNQPIQVFGGMQKGLPLANPAQQGLLVQGMIFPALGNWVGTDMTLDFYIAAPVGEGNPTKAANIVHNWQQGQPLSQAIKQSLTTAFPKFTPVINISPSLVLSYADTGFYQTIGQYATYIFNISKSIMNSSTYHGVQMSVQGKKIVVTDGTAPAGNAIQINFQDLIGQPIWTHTNTIQFKTVMRGDINLGDRVTLPKALATTTNFQGAGAVGGANSNLIQGTFLVGANGQGIRHTGNFRQPDWASWCTTFDCIGPVS
jgi:hypothetical protein